MIREITRCRVCGSEELTLVLNLGSQVLTGVFPKTRTESITSGPLELVKCTSDRGCGLVQLHRHLVQQILIERGKGLQHPATADDRRGRMQQLVQQFRVVFQNDLVDFQ